MKHTIILLYLISGIWISTGCRSMPPGPNRDLIDEAKNGDTAAIQRALDAGADINTRNEDGMTALMAAAIFNRYNAVKLLLDKGADKNLKDQNGLTALRWASFPSTAGDKTEIVKLLSSSASAPQNTAKQQNRVPVASTPIRANANNDLINAVASGDMAVVEAALQAKASIKAKNPDDQTPLMLAAKNGHIEIVKRLIAAKADVNAKNCCYTPLILAAENGHIEIVKLFLSMKANVNARSRGGNCAVNAAAFGGHVEIIRLLITAGAKLSYVDNSGASLMSQAAKGGHPEAVKAVIEAGADISLGLIGLAQAGDINAGTRNEIFQMLMKAGAAVDATDYTGSQALQYASPAGHIEFVKQLIAAGADVNAKNRFGNNALGNAAIKGQVEIVKLLIAANANVNMSNEDGVTDLMVAAGNGHLEVVRLLIAANANVKAKSKYGYTALKMAMDAHPMSSIDVGFERYKEQNRAAIVALLKAAGAVE